MEIPVNLIQCEEKELDSNKLADIKESIQEQGLLHPITVQSVNDSDSFLLVTGRYRLEAVKLLNKSTIDAKIISNDADDVRRQEIHLHENLRRGQLPWHEEVQLVKQLHDLRQTQHGASTVGRPEGKKKGWGLRDTAEELGKALGGIAQDLQLARMVQNNPSLKNIKDKATATKVIKQTAARIYAEEEAVVSGDHPFSDEIFLGEATTILEQLPETVFDFCITDPPWWKFAKSEDPSLKRDEFTLPVFKALFRCMKWDSFMYLFCGEEDFTFYKRELPPQGWKIQGHPCIWKKENFLSRTGMRGWEHGRDIELILLAVKGNPVLPSSTQISSVFTHAVVPSQKLRHPNEKPVSLIYEMVKTISYTGSFGIDPFAGSGAHLQAMDDLKRHYVGIERDPERYQKIKERMKKK